MEGAVTSGALKYQGVGRRFVAVLIDGVLMFAVAFVLSLIFGGAGGEGFSLSGAPAFLWFLIGVAYFILMEAYVGATVGKLALGMRVVKLDGSPCDLTASLVRNLLRIVDGLFGYLVGAILVWTSEKRQRLGDRVANTVVVSRG